MAEVAKRNWNEAFWVAVVNPAGELVYFAKGDNCQNASVTISQHKARTAARYRRPTAVFERLTTCKPVDTVSGTAARNASENLCAAAASRGATRVSDLGTA
jgi:uncharacterized protein GlcG (DUF336 family)